MSFVGYQKKERKAWQEPPPKVKESQEAKPASRRDDNRELRLYEVKTRVHHRLLERLDLSLMEDLDETDMAREIRQALDLLLQEEAEPLNLGEKTRLASRIKSSIPHKFFASFSKTRYLLPEKFDLPIPSLVS